MTVAHLIAQLRVWRAELRKMASAASPSATAELGRAGGLIDQACAILEGLRAPPPRDPPQRGG